MASCLLVLSRTCSAFITSRHCPAIGGLPPRLAGRTTGLRSTGLRRLRASVATPPLAPCKPPSIVDSDGEMAKQYDFNAVESGLYEWWEREGYFKPAGDPSKPSYTVPMPPPNVTGYLHMGHAMFVALQDILTRFHRMRGEPTLWLPGTDHAGIATQMLVERALRAEGVERTALGREKFLEKVWEWKEEKGGYIIGQMRSLGASADWSRERFTLEPDLSNAVIEAFVRLHEKGLVYKGDYMVNWSPSLQTAVSDLEVEYSEEAGKLYYFKYQVAGGSAEDFIPVATTRPETILGDTAVCVHPEDPRYKHLIGKSVVVPIQGREIPVIADTYVDMEFGTGALKITPGHDINDYEIGKRYKLPTINIMNKDATINGEGGAYEGLDRFECRQKLWDDMEKEGLTMKVEPHTQRVPRSQRGGEVIEPLVSAQWFVKMDNMAARALDAVNTKEITILPERFEKTWQNWLGNIHDWCVSRQLWWGHRIPVWYPQGQDGYFVARNEVDARAQATAAGISEHTKLRQDDDVLDTWFSSGLWPFATVGWPQGVDDPSSDYNKFYPAVCLETGYDILFFWVARMVMMGLELTDKSPFKVVYLHGLVRDAEGAKMSKTKGNVIDPLEVCRKYGADALRYTLVTGVTPGQDIPLSMERVEASRNFANKLWNAGRYLLGNLKDLSPEEFSSLAVRGPMSSQELSSLPMPERHIVSKVHLLVASVTSGLEAYNMGDAGRLIYEFLWDEYADWYLEASKTRMSDRSSIEAKTARRVLVYVFDSCLRLLHPFMPFVTEALWQQLPHIGDALITAPWPQEGSTPLVTDETATARFESLQALVRGIREARAEYKVEPAKKISAQVLVADSSLRSDFISEKAALALLARLDPKQLTVTEPVEMDQSTRSVHCVIQDGLEAYLPMSGMVDATKERARLIKQAEKIRKDLDGLNNRLNAKGFVDKASPAVVEATRAQAQEMQDKLNSVLASAEALG